MRGGEEIPVETQLQDCSRVTDFDLADFNRSGVTYDERRLFNHFVFSLNGAAHA